jgi:hypothetical protein
MAIPSTSLPTKPAGRTLAEFEPLSPVEQKLLAAARTGEICDLREHDRIERELQAAQAQSEAIKEPEAIRTAAIRRPPAKTDANSIRPSFLRFLILGGDERAPVHEHGIRLKGAWVDGPLDLAAVEAHASVFIEESVIDSDVILYDAQLVGLVLSGSQVREILGDRVRTAGSIFLRKGFVAKGPVGLPGAVINGDFDCSAGRFDGADEDGNALFVDGARITGDVLLVDGFVAKGAIRLVSAAIGGNFYCWTGLFEGADQDGNALLGDRATIAGSVFLRHGFVAMGAVRLSGATIGGDLDCSAGQFHCKTETAALRGDGAKDAWVALGGDGAKIAGSVLLRDGFVAMGLVRLLGATIGGNLDCSAGHFHCKAENAALRRDGAEVAEVAFGGDGAKIAGSVFLGRGFVAMGQVRLPAAAIGGVVDCSGARLEGGVNRFALFFDGARISGALLLQDHEGTKFSAVGGISLAGAQVARLADQIERWPAYLNLDGFRYDLIAADSTIGPAARIAWLDKNLVHNPDLPFSPKPWEQLAKVLRAGGHEAEARRIAIAKEDRLRKDSRIRTGKTARDHIRGPVARPAHWVFGLLARYGYAPFRLVSILALLWIVSSVFFWFAAERGVFAPSNPLVFQNPQLAHCSPDSIESERVAAKALADRRDEPFAAANWYLCPQLPAEYTTFQPFLYALDLLLPLVELQQDRDWAPMICTPLSVATSSSWPTDWGAWFTTCGLRSFTRWVMWFQILFGWVASLMLVAAVSRLASRDRG